MFSCQTYASNVLIAINPFDQSPNNQELYGAGKIAQFTGKTHAEQPPHIYSIGDIFFIIQLQNFNIEYSRL